MKTLLFVLTTFLSLNALAGGTNIMIRSDANGGMCMDAKGDQKKDGTPVFIYKCHGRENQRWAVSSDENGQSAIIGTGGFCLDVRGTHSFKDGTPVQLWKCHFGGNQRFNVTGDGHIKEAASGKCLMATHEKDGAPIVLDECGKSKVERWSLKN